PTGTTPPRPPSMDALLREPEAVLPLTRFGREAVKEELRRAIAGGETRAAALWDSARKALERRFAPPLPRAVNATGVPRHTNLGRARLGEAARAAIAGGASGSATVEYEPGPGTRGRRQDHVRAAARELFGCADAIAVTTTPRRCCWLWRRWRADER